MSMCYWLHFCLQLAHATEMKEDKDKGDRGVLSLCYRHLISVLGSFACWQKKVLCKLIPCVTANKVGSVP